MKKIGLICLAVVLALGGLGIGFAHWSDNLYIDGTVNTGEVLIGFVDQATDDDGTPGVKDPDDTGADPLWTGVDPPTVCGKCPNIGKPVASTTCLLSEQRRHSTGELAEHGDPPVPQFGLMTITMDNVYPQYNPTVWFDIANCGSVPVNIVGAWIIDGAHGVDPAVPATWIYLPKCQMIQVDLDCDDDDDVAIGFSAPLDAAGEVIEPQQIDPCEVAQYDLHFYFKQDLNQCTTYDFTIKIHAVQWNYAWVFPEGLP